MSKPVEPKVPDGGWGWAVVAGVALINSFNQSILSVFGLLFGEHLQNMGEGTSGAALVSNLNSLALNLSGLFIGPAIKTFAPRRIAYAGVLLTSLGMCLCSVSTRLWHVILCYSVIMGLGLGLIAPSSFMAINSYFKEKRGIAVGAAMAGTGVGQMLFPHIVRYLLDYYGFRVAAIVLGSLCLHGLVGASLFLPLQPPKRKRRNNVTPLLHDNRMDSQKVPVKNDVSYEVDPSYYSNDKRKSLDDHEITFIADPIDNVRHDGHKKHNLCQKIMCRVANAMDLKLLKDPVFVSICTGIALVYTSTINFMMLFPYFLQFSANLSRQDTAICMSALAGADVICRLGFPVITDRLKMPYRLAFLLGGAGMLFGRTILAETTNFTALIILAAICGGFKSATVVNNNLSISEYCSPENLAGALGLNMIAKGIFAISFGQVLGWIRDYTGSYPLSLHAQDALIVVVLIMWLPEMIYKYCRKHAKSHSKANSISL